jgi:hypothetical protein
MKLISLFLDWSLLVYIKKEPVINIKISWKVLLEMPCFFLLIANPNVFNFYVYLRTHPLLIRQYIASTAQDKKKAHAVVLSGFSYGSDAKPSNPDKQVRACLYVISMIISTVFSSVQGICSVFENGPITLLYTGPSHLLGSNNEIEVLGSIRTWLCIFHAILFVM